MIEAQFLYNPTEKGLYCHAPTLLETATGKLLAAWYAYPEEEQAEASLVLTQRHKGEKNWTPSKGVLGSFGSSAGNPVLFQSPTGTIWLLFVLLKGNSWNDAELQGAWSEDEGVTWSAPSRLWPERGMMVRHPPVLLDKEILLLPAYNEISRESVLLTAQPPYKEWRLTHRFPEMPLIQPVIVRQGPERLAIFFRPAADPRRIWRSHSTDEGGSWSTPVRTPLPSPLSGIGAFAVGKDIALIYNHTEEHRRYPLSIALSQDDCISWGEPWHIENIPFEVCYPSFFSGSDGSIHGVYTYNRRMIKYVSFRPEQLPR